MRPGARSPKRNPAAVPLIVLVALATAVGVAGLAGVSAHGGADAHMTVVAKDAGCSGGESLCFDVALDAGSIIEPGIPVTITFRNDAENDHTLYVTTIEEADTGGRDSKPGVAFAETPGNVAPGNETQLNFFAPGKSEALYLWCELGAHEGAGMYATVPIEGGAPDDGNGGGSDTPLSWAVAVTGLLGAVLVAGRRRRG